MKTTKQIASTMTESMGSVISTRAKAAIALRVLLEECTELDFSDPDPAISGSIVADLIYELEGRND